MKPIYLLCFVIQFLLIKNNFCDAEDGDLLNGIEDHIDKGKNLLQLIKNVQNQVSSHTISQNAHEYKPISNKTFDFGEFDFIIIGAGSTGSVLASRLSEIPEWKVLLLEAGDFGNQLTDIPALAFPLEFTSYNWGYYSVPQKFSCLGMQNRQCIYPRGRGVGGTSLINAMLYSLPSREDLKSWENAGNPGWNYESVLPYFKKLEHLNIDRIFDNPIDRSIHGYQGPLNIEFHSPLLPVTQAFLAGNRELGVKMVDYNNPDAIGASAFQMTTINGSRMDTGKAYIEPFRNRGNLKIITKSYVTKILIDPENVARGVEFTSKFKKYVAKARKEVILSAGTINSPVVLMHSGIGPKNHLQDLNMEVKKNLEVGSNLLDHPNFIGFTFAFKNPVNLLKEAAMYAKNGTGVFASLGYDISGVFLPSKQSKSVDLEIASTIIDKAGLIKLGLNILLNLRLETVNDMLKGIGLRSVLHIFATYCHAKSRGTIRLKSNDPFDYPLIDPNILSDPEDLEKIYETVQHLLKLSESKSFKEGGLEMFVQHIRACKDYKFKSKDFWVCYIRQLTMGMFHPVGTCKMGPESDREAVVDHDCKVHGVKNLRVIDASVIPFNLAAHPNSVVVMMGEKMSDQIKKQYGMEI